MLDHLRRYLGLVLEFAWSGWQGCRLVVPWARLCCPIHARLVANRLFVLGGLPQWLINHTVALTWHSLRAVSPQRGATDAPRARASGRNTGSAARSGRLAAAAVRRDIHLAAFVRSCLSSQLTVQLVGLEQRKLGSRQYCLAHCCLRRPLQHSRLRRRDVCAGHTLGWLQSAAIFSWGKLASIMRRKHPLMLRMVNRMGAFFKFLNRRGWRRVRSCAAKEKAFAKP